MNIPQTVVLCKDFVPFHELEIKGLTEYTENDILYIIPTTRSLKWVNKLEGRRIIVHSIDDETFQEVLLPLNTLKPGNITFHNKL